jgi:hypothetical protein
MPSLMPFVPIASLVSSVGLQKYEKGQETDPVQAIPSKKPAECISTPGYQMESKQ